MAETGMADAPVKAEAKWYEGHDEIMSNADLLKHVQDHKFDSPVAVVKSDYELQKKLGSSYRLPNDLKSLSPEQQVDILARTKGLMDVPDKPEGYDFGELQLPEGLPRDENLEIAFKGFCKEQGISKAAAKALYDFYNTAMITTYNKNQEASVAEVKKAEQELRIAGKFDQVMESVKRCRIWAAEKFGFGYQDTKTNEIRSRLDDCLDDTKLGNKMPILQLLAGVYDMFVAEGEPVRGSGEAGVAGRDFFKYDKVDK